ncbi:uncharacterized protein LOC116206773 [Punica granatum]|uniref:Uncharacterized protein n=2 Tax=Punica granatum TaxID=22663 RepID=A0A218XCB0_PUNGR|nr:uncharacterized protein LOC116206773 [Punica granatum]OWM82577.1 hypothetical protein CDL15_Pgr002152 [Punica granatum]PKI48251.1 hypothetical protein CRG98_031353 [Punica granatum]
MSGNLSKLAIVLTVVFAVSVTALVAQLICVKWRQRRFRRRSLGAGDRESNSSAADVAAAFYSPSKELLYFFCWKNQSRVEPNGRVHEARSSTTESEEDIDDILKWHGTMFGPPRFLFTIREDQEREVESESDVINNNSNGSGPSAPPVEEIMRKRVSLRECLEAPEAEAEALPVAEAEADDEVAVTVVSFDVTPFSTPCASPTYFTPSPSPARDSHVDTHPEGDTSDLSIAGLRSSVEERKAPEFVSLEIGVA